VVVIIFLLAAVSFLIDVYRQSRSIEAAERDVRREEKARGKFRDCMNNFSKQIKRGAIDPATHRPAECLLRYYLRTKGEPGGQSGSKEAEYEFWRGGPLPGKGPFRDYIRSGELRGIQSSKRSTGLPPSGR